MAAESVRKSMKFLTKPAPEDYFRLHLGLKSLSATVQTKFREIMPRTSVDEPCTNLNFRVELDGLTIEGFCHVGELESLIPLDEGKKSPSLKRRGKPSFGNIVLRRAIDQRRDLWNWYQAILKGENDRRDGSIVILNAAREEFLRIQVRRAWPCRWKLTALDALHPEVLLEEVELVIESFQLK
jgi:phage tail-like protein